MSNKPLSIPPPPGLYVAPVMFFDDNEEFDFPAIKLHLLRLAHGGVTGIFITGSYGEAQHLSHDERKTIIRFTRQTLDENGFKDIVLISGTGTQSTRETMKLNVDAREAGAAYALIFTPSTWRARMTREAIIRFHVQVADASPIPTMIYNNPGNTAGINIDSDMFIELGRHPNIVGAKLGCSDLAKLTRIVTTLPQSQFSVFTATSDTLLPALMLKAAGGNTALLNIAPKVHCRMLSLYESGKVDEALDIHRILAHCDNVSRKLGGPAFLKAIVSKKFGYGDAVIRGPLLGVPSVDELRDEDAELMDELINLEKSL
ncbi:hypothetical protein HETIRDRAFT_412119 [Heterobasidion irregulare TC 32-1]|uniref:Dihydrodipicolinate synthase n=1 Tax=Heterobasidion irregulare (strain TC 32-1) TaxID=747525 RepID=W4JQ78_HETIT|nr:uncharacterized protein HETIRDRAFT_412119 [Heterobasidion irregulare TC 32-1]ETW75717.1 hypothetical protein HETIRDRAFT_412119 [Heterobasidion irregulare TC 32-1]